MVVDGSAVMLFLLTILRSLERPPSVEMEMQEDASDSGRLPVDQLLTIFRTTVTVVLGGTTSAIRKNLYCVILNYLQYTAPPIQPFMYESQGDLQEVQFEQEQINLDTGNLAIVHHQGTKLLEIICRDTSNADESLRAVAYTALDSLLVLSTRGRSHNVLEFLLRTNFLQQFIFTLKEEDRFLQATLEPSPESLNALYVFEAKMGLLLRISQSKLGAENLLSNGLLEMLADCKFVDFRPEDSTALGLPPPPPFLLRC